MRNFAFFVASGLLVLFFAGLYSETLQGTLKYRRETNKKCTFCHTAIPEQGDEDPRLNEEGKIFKRNGYKLTEEQKKKPPVADPS